MASADVIYVDSPTSDLAAPSASDASTRVVPSLPSVEIAKKKKKGLKKRKESESDNEKKEEEESNKKNKVKKVKKHKKRDNEDKKSKSVSFPVNDKELRRVKNYVKNSILPKEEEVGAIPASLLFLDEASNDGAYQQAILDSLSRPPSVSPPPVVEPTIPQPDPELQFDQHGSNISTPTVYDAPQPLPPQPLPPSAATAAPTTTPFVVPPPVTFEAFMHYYFELSQHKIDRMHHPYHHVTIEAVDVIQFIRVGNCLDQPLTFVIPLSSPFYKRTMEYTCHRESNVSKLCEWLLNYFRPQQLGPNQVATNIHTILIPEDTPGNWARLFA